MKLIIRDVNKLVKMLVLVLLVQANIFAQKSAKENDIELAHEYFNKGEYAKALEIYSKASKNEENLAAIHRNYVECMVKTKNFDQAEKYLKRLIKGSPLFYLYNVDYAILLEKMGKVQESNTYLTDYLSKIKSDNNELRNVGKYCINQSKFDFAEQAFLLGRKHTRDNFSQDLAELYGITGNNEKMIIEYLDMLERDQFQIEFVENVLQTKLTDEKDLAKLEELLYKYVQRLPDNITYNEMLLWLYLQRRDFFKAFQQAKAIDRRNKMEGFKIYEIGMLSLGHKDYRNSIKIFEYLVGNYKNREIYPTAKRMLVKSKEELVKNTYPVNLEEIKSLAKEYQGILEEVGFSPITAESARNMALLYGFYLNNTDTAVAILDKVINLPRHDRTIVSNAKLDLGDIYLLRNEAWESTLLYSQVEKAERETNIGHLAKLKNAKLSYYKGEFNLAKEHLDILKLATSREISNDAIQLSLLIQDNLELDTSDAAMKEYADIDLLVFQGQIEKAIKRLDLMQKNFSKHSLMDEILWQKANLLLKMGKYEEALSNLEVILKAYADDIHADDANFLSAKIYDDFLKNRDKAMEMYQLQLTQFPGSVFNVEARKRYRELRGDKVSQ